MRKSKNVCDLKSCFLCKSCNREWLPFIDMYKQNRSFKKGEIIFSEGEKVEGIYFLFTGKVKVYKQWNEEKELIIRFAKEGDVLGHRGFGNNAIYPVSAAALEETVVCYIAYDFFLTSLKMNHELTYKLMMFYSAELQDAEHRMRDLVHMDTKGKIADALLMMRTQFGTDENGFIDMNLSRRDLSSFVGATYETVFKLINELTAEKAIRIEGKNIQIINEKKMRAYIQPTPVKK
ncbi:MAG: Crp/Fnr family transcriptional regulator [Bacteroidota bacterium]